MNENAGALLRGSTSEWVAQGESQGEKFDMNASVPCQGCLNGYGCYNEELCSNYYAASYQTPTQYDQSFSNSMAQPNIHPAPYGPVPTVNQPFYDYTNPPPHHHHHQQFMGYQQPHHFYYGQPPAYGSPHYMTRAPYFPPRHQGPPRRNSKGYRPNNRYTAAPNQVYEEPDVGSDTSSLTFCGNLSEDVRRAVAFVKRNHNATLFQIEGKGIVYL